MRSFHRWKKGFHRPLRRTRSNPCRRRWCRLRMIRRGRGRSERWTWRGVSACPKRRRCGRPALIEPVVISTTAPVRRPLQNGAGVDTLMR